MIDKTSSTIIRYNSKKCKDFALFVMIPVKFKFISNKMKNEYVEKIFKLVKDNIMKEGDNAQDNNAIMDNTITMLINLFLRTKSPNGTRNRIPNAYPI